MAASVQQGSTRVRVRYAETDQMGVVYHANYFVWMEIARIDLARHRGFDYAEIERTERLVMAVVEAECRYLYPARFDQEVLIATRVLEASPRTITFGYELKLAGSDRMLATAKTRHMWLNGEMRPSRLPEKYSDLAAIG